MYEHTRYSQLLEKGLMPRAGSHYGVRRVSNPISLIDRVATALLIPWKNMQTHLIWTRLRMDT